MKPNIARRVKRLDYFFSSEVDVSFRILKRIADPHLQAVQQIVLDSEGEVCCAMEGKIFAFDS